MPRRSGSTGRRPELPGYWRNRKRASFARTRYRDRNPDTPFSGLGVLAQSEACDLSKVEVLGSKPRYSTQLSEIRMV